MSLQGTPVIPAMYFGPVELYRLLAAHPRAIVDAGEHYERQSHRTRTRILGPNGSQDLVVQIRRRSGEKMPMHSVELSFAEHWPGQHLHALRSAYGNTPWYLHFSEELEDLLHGPHTRLLELDLASMRMALRVLGLSCALEVSTVYVEPDREDIIDLRQQLHPKRPLPDWIPAVPSYPQIFADRHGFVERLSVLDLLCNSGPQARGHLVREQR
jgi:hypothetical protein